VNLVDLAALGIFALAILFGWRSGFVVQALALVGFIGGILLIVGVAPHLTGFVADMDPWVRTILVLGLMGGVVLLAQALGSSLGVALRRRMGSGVLGGVDQGLGAAFGILRGIFTVWLIGGLIALLPLSQLASEARQSVVLNSLQSRLPSPVVMAAELGRLMQQAGLPDVLVGAPPPIDVPANGPTTAEAQAIVGDSRVSTVRVESIACGRFMSGSGFAVTRDHFVTNAHVVAGSNQVWISFDGSLDRLTAKVVHIDPSLDIALLEVDGANVPPLTLAGALPSRGEQAAALGYTGGGRLRLIPGVVSRTLSALGRDIYGGSIVPREIIEMRVDVAPGDSGGPLLLPDGTVGGVTFSESRQDPQIGYALSPTAVADAIDSSLRSNAPVGTGACLTNP
jgi:S1-C subfamily serine protease